MDIINEYIKNVPKVDGGVVWYNYYSRLVFIGWLVQ